MRDLPPEPIHLPFHTGPYRMSMDLTTAPESAWFEIDALYPTEMAERRRLLAEAHADVFGTVPGSDAARAETLALVAAALTAHHPDWFALDGGTLHNRLTGEAWMLDSPPLDPLELAGRLVQEDLCLLRLTEDGPVLMAAVLCFPARWRLAEKIGRPLAGIHGPVPLYGEKLARPVDRFMAALKPGRLAERLNWSMMDDPTLFQPTGHGRTEANAAITAENAGDRIFLRVERQTLSLLPASGAVLFTIRTHCYPIARIAADRQAAADLAAAVRALPDTLRRYKSLLPFQPALLAYLDGRAA